MADSPPFLVSCSLTSLQAAENFNASRVRLRFTRVKINRKHKKAAAIIHFEMESMKSCAFDNPVFAYSQLRLS